MDRWPGFGLLCLSAACLRCAARPTCCCAASASPCLLGLFCCVWYCFGPSISMALAWALHLSSVACPLTYVLQYPFSAEHGEDAWLVNFLFWEKRNGFYLEVVSGVCEQ